MKPFGTRDKVIPGGRIETECPHCGQRELISYTIVRYVRIFWIPVFPTSRQIFWECPNCQYTRRLGKKFQAHFSDS